MRIFVTGATGFIGTEFCRQAVASGHDILALHRPHRLATPPWEAITAFKPEVAVHCAWIAIPGSYQNAPENLTLHRESLDLYCRLCELGLSQFVGLGTCAEYAASASDLDEDISPLDPGSIYALAKHELHMELKKMAFISTTLTWLRIFYPYGPSEHPDRLISSVIRGFLQGPRVEIRTPHAVRDYIHVTDVAAAILSCINARAEGCYNVGSGHGVELGELESTIGVLTGKRTTHNKADGRDSADSANRVVASTSKLRSLGWVPRQDLASGLATYNQRLYLH